MFSIRKRSGSNLRGSGQTSGFRWRAMAQHETLEPLGIRYPSVEGWGYVWQSKTIDLSMIAFRPWSEVRAKSLSTATAIMQVDWQNIILDSLRLAFSVSRERYSFCSQPPHSLPAPFTLRCLPSLTQNLSLFSLPLYFLLHSLYLHTSFVPVSPCFALLSTSPIPSLPFLPFVLLFW